MRIAKTDAPTKAPKSLLLQERDSFDGYSTPKAIIKKRAEKSPAAFAYSAFIHRATTHCTTIKAAMLATAANQNRRLSRKANGEDGSMVFPLSLISNVQ